MLFGVDSRTVKAAAAPAAAANDKEWMRSDKQMTMMEHKHLNHHYYYHNLKKRIIFLIILSFFSKKEKENFTSVGRLPCVFEHFHIALLFIAQLEPLRGFHGFANSWTLSWPSFVQMLLGIVSAECRFLFSVQ